MHGRGDTDERVFLRDNMCSGNKNSKSVTQLTRGASRFVWYRVSLGSAVEAFHGAGCMPPRKISISADIENLIQEACTQLRTQAKPIISVVIHEIKARTGVTLLYHTVRNRFLGKHVPPKQAHVNQQLLSSEAERVLVDWIIFLSDTGHPLSKRTIRAKARTEGGLLPCKPSMRHQLDPHQCHHIHHCHSLYWPHSQTS